MDPTDWETAKQVLGTARLLAPGDAYVLQQLALATYKSKRPTPEGALTEARAILSELRPEMSNDPETLGIWGAIHKQQWDQDRTDRGALDTAIDAYQRGFELRGDYYNGINVAFLFNERAAISTGADAVADFVLAQRIRRRVQATCRELLNGPNLTATEQYWLHATLGETRLGLGSPFRDLDELLQDAVPHATEPWMVETTKAQLRRLSALIARTPLADLRPPVD